MNAISFQQQEGVASASYEMPRERLLRLGPQALSDEELLRILLGSGTKGRSVNSIARELLRIIDTDGAALCAKRLMQLEGMGVAKSCLLLAAIEFTRRRINTSGVRVRAAKDVFPLLSYLGERRQEHFICISLNGAHEVIASRIVTVGLLNCCQVHPREVFSDPITDRAAAVIVAHNHPSGDLTPSVADLDLTRRLAQAAHILGLRLLDHVIFSTAKFQSLAELHAELFSCSN